MTRRHDIDPMAGHQVPGPPASLEGRVLAATAAALRDPAVTTVWDRLWTSRPLRLAWSLAFVGLLAAHAAISVPRSEPGEATRRAAGRAPSDELRDEVALPTVDISPRAEALVMEPELSNSNDKEKEEVPS